MEFWDFIYPFWTQKQKLENPPPHQQKYGTLGFYQFMVSGNINNFKIPE